MSGTSLSHQDVQGTYLWFAEMCNANIFSGDWVVWLFIDYLLIKMAFYSDIIINCFKLLANKSANSLRLCERVFPSTWLNCGTVARKQRAEFSDFYYILALLGSTVQWRGGPTPLSGCEQLKIHNEPSVSLTAQEALNLIQDTLKMTVRVDSRGP